jgi:hypothetical protein
MIRGIIFALALEAVGAVLLVLVCLAVTHFSK